MPTTSLFFQDERSDKVYTIVVEPQKAGTGFNVTAIYGRRGGAMQNAPKGKGLSADAAQKLHDSLVAEKTAKGYRFLASDTATAVQVPETPATTPAAPDSAFTRALPEIPAHMLLNEIGQHEADALMAEDTGLWILQPKADGVRCRMIIDDANEVCGISRTNKPLSIPMAVVNFLKTKFKGVSAVLDGELVGDTYICFDVLHLGNIGSTQFWKQPASVRATWVTKNFPNSPDAPVLGTVTAYTAAQKQQLFCACQANGAEGVVIKKNVPYSPGRPNSGGVALKLKFVKTASVICAGPNGTKSSFKMKLFDGTELGSVTVPPNKTMPSADGKTVVEVRYLYVGPGGHLVQAVYLGVREDILPEECTAEQLQIKGAAR